jgi:hypothetical protein
VDPRAILHVGVLVDLAAQLVAEQVDLAARAVLGDPYVAGAAPRGDPAGVEDELVEALGRLGRHGARPLDLAGDGDVEDPGREHRDADVGEAQQRAGALGDAPVGLQERPPADVDAAEGRDVDDALGVHDDLKSRDVEPAGDLDVENVPVAEAVIWTRDVPWREDVGADLARARGRRQRRQLLRSRDRGGAGGLGQSDGGGE